jgi:ribose transport system substrate-binding protein
MPLIHEAARANVAWVMLSRWNDAIHEFRRQYSKVPIFAVLPDHVEIGRIQGQQLRLVLAPGDELIYIQGPRATYSTRRRLMGIEKELGNVHDFRWAHYNADWSVAGGESAMASWLSTFTTRKSPEFVIAAQNDNMAMGARQAVQEWANRGGQLPARHLRVLGCDGVPRYGQRLVTTGDLLATVIIPPLSTRALQEVVACFRTGKQPPAEIDVAVQSYPALQELSRGTPPSL